MAVRFVCLDGAFVRQGVAGDLTVCIHVGNGGTDGGRADVDAERQTVLA